MNPKKYLENRIRGWLPEETGLPRHQQGTNSKTWRIRIIEFALILVVGSFVAGLLGGLVYSLGLYSGLGMYVWPMIIGIVIAMAANTVLTRNKQKEERQSSIEKLKS